MADTYIELCSQSEQSKIIQQHNCINCDIYIFVSQETGKPSRNQNDETKHQHNVNVDENNNTMIIEVLICQHQKL